MSDIHGIDKSTYEKLSNRDKLNILFGFIVDIHTRIKVLENRRIKNSILIAVSGFLGGLMGILLKPFISK